MAEQTPETPRKKRKYTKKSKMLLRSNNDYIDHDYWKNAYADAKIRNERMLKRYGVKAVPDKPPAFTESEKEQLKKQGIGKHIAIPQTPGEPFTRIPISEG